MFQVNGSLMYVDPQGVSTGYADVFTRMEAARAHYVAVGLGESQVEQFIRQHRKAATRISDHESRITPGLIQAIIGLAFFHNLT